MKNLENFGVQELNAKEINETSGGFGGWLLGGLAFSLLYGTVEDWEGNVNAFKESYNRSSQ